MAVLRASVVRVREAVGERKVARVAENIASLHPRKASFDSEFYAAGRLSRFFAFFRRAHSGA